MTFEKKGVDQVEESVTLEQDLPSRNACENSGWMACALIWKSAPGSLPVNATD